MRDSLVRPRLFALVLALGMLLAAALALAAGSQLSQTIQSELIQGTHTKWTVLAEGVAAPRRPMTP
ncbi:hypothetical protein AB0I81_26595 [Nonomuraea sp. NPDC050404]|uniref:hypothetical protein n=1 Tax=Nonomuraea sp. NPDC050404 TaxID=3155783 RepID=UPI0033C47C82